MPRPPGRSSGFRRIDGLPLPFDYPGGVDRPSTIAAVTAGSVAALAFVAFLLVAYLIGARKAWRGTGPLDAAPAPAWWFLSEPVWRGVKRSFVAFAPFVILFLAGGATSDMVEEGSTAWTVAMVVGGVGLVGSLAVQLPIILYNRPKALVPPHLRGEPGTRQQRRRPAARE